MGDDAVPTAVALLASAVDPKAQLIDLLGIEAHLTGSGEVSLPLAYQKYKAFLLACQTLKNMVENQTWPIKQPTQTELIELFVSRSFFHSHYAHHFPKVVDYPLMKAWLEGESESADVDVWGVKKASYGFADLKVWLENEGTLELDDEDEEFERYKVVKRGKGKGRGKDLEKKKGKGKGKEKEKGHKKGESSKRAK
jgi:hypothetical protein